MLENGYEIELEYGSDTNKTVIVQDIVNGNNASIQSQFVQDRAAVILHQVVFSLEKHLTGGCENGWKPSEKH